MTYLLMAFYLAEPVIFSGLRCFGSVMILALRLVATRLVHSSTRDDNNQVPDLKSISGTQAKIGSIRLAQQFLEGHLEIL